MSLGAFYELAVLVSGPGPRAPMDQRETFTARAGVDYATVGRGKRVHYSPRNDDTLCGRAISAYKDLESAVALFDKGYELCATCHLPPGRRAAGRGRPPRRRLRRDRRAGDGRRAARRPRRHVAQLNTGADLLLADIKEVGADLD